MICIQKYFMRNFKPEMVLNSILFDFYNFKPNKVNFIFFEAKIICYFYVKLLKNPH